MKRSARIVAGLAAGTVTLALLQSAAPAAQDPIRLTKPVQATKSDVDPGRLYSDPAFAIDPENPLRVIAGFADHRTRRCGLLRSVDGGQTWTRLDSSPDTATYPFCSQGQGGVVQAPVAFGGKGSIYMALGGWGAEDTSRNGGAVLLARSTDLGDSWQTTVIRSSRGKSGDDAENLRPVQSIAVDRKTGKDDTVYVTFALTRPNVAAPNAIPASPMVAVSHDGGRSFGEPVNLAQGVFDSDAIRTQAISAATTSTVAAGATTTTTKPPPADSKAANPNQVANFGSAGSRNGMVARLDGKGNAYVTWPTGTANITPSPPGGLALSKSTDGGKTWSSAIALPFSYENATGGPAGAYPQFAVSKNGTLHIVFNRNATPDIANYSSVFHRASYDGGKTWTDPQPLAEVDPRGFAAQFFPNLSIAPNGRIDVVWWDTRDDPGIRSNDVYYSYSNDDGKTWSKNRRISDQTVDRRLGIWGVNYDITSPPGVASANAYAVIGWDDTRNTDQAIKDNTSLGGGLQDIYTAAVQFEAVGGGTSRAAKYALAGIIGILGVGVILLLGAVLTRRRGGPEAPASSATETKTASKVG